MTIGVPKEIKIGETRVSMTPSLCRRVTSLGGKVLVEKNAGAKAGYTDAEYKAAGAAIATSADKVWKSADLILKVKEPQESEFSLMQQGQTIFTYLHLAACPDLAKELCRKNILGIAYETVESADGQFPLLKPMSQIAGRLSIQIGAYFLQSQLGGSGVLLGGIPGTMPGHVVVVGAGNSGAHAVRMAAGMGSRVTVLDLDTRKLEVLDQEYRGKVITLVSNPANIEAEVALSVSAPLDRPDAWAPRIWSIIVVSRRAGIALRTARGAWAMLTRPSANSSSVVVSVSRIVGKSPDNPEALSGQGLSSSSGCCPLAKGAWTVAPIRS